MTYPLWNMVREKYPAARLVQIWGDSVEFRRLWDGLPMLLSRELPFGVTKLFVYAATQARTCCCCSSDYSGS